MPTDQNGGFSGWFDIHVTSCASCNVLMAKDERMRQKHTYLSGIVHSGYFCSKCETKSMEMLTPHVSDARVIVVLRNKKGEIIKQELRDHTPSSLEFLLNMLYKNESASAIIIPDIMISKYPALEENYDISKLQWFPVKDFYTHYWCVLIPIHGVKKVMQDKFDEENWFEPPLFETNDDKRIKLRKEINRLQKDLASKKQKLSLLN